MTPSTTARFNQFKQKFGVSQETLSELRIIRAYTLGRVAAYIGDGIPTSLSASAGGIEQLSHVYNKGVAASNRSRNFLPTNRELADDNGPMFMRTPLGVMSRSIKGGLILLDRDLEHGTLMHGTLMQLDPYSRGYYQHLFHTIVHRNTEPMRNTSPQ